MRVFHFISDRYALDVIASQRIKVSRFDDLNDPFELHAVDLSDKQYRKEFVAFKQHMAERVGLLCFSKNWNSPLLWSHYANRHKGVALEFEVPNDVLHPVKYQKERPTVDIKMIRKRHDGFDRPKIEAIWMTKYVQWDVEDEIRMVLHKSEFYQDKDLYFYDLGKEIHLTGVVLGPFCDITASEIEKCLPNGLQISVTKSRLAFGSFNIVNNRLFKVVRLVGQGTRGLVRVGTNND